MKKRIFAILIGLLMATSSAYAHDPFEVVGATHYEPLPGEWLGNDWVLTAYCGCPICCGKWATDGVVIGAGGVPLIEGVHIASPLPNGTELYVEGYGTYEVQDKTANWIVDKYNGHIIDIYFSSHESALRFGKRTSARVWKVME